jgi:pimeloyl-ACP methyl ester carboxylesterase
MTERTYVLVHGGFHGGWCYARVAKILRAAGHQVYTPTLTGLGERSHLVDGVNCSTHIQDVLNVIKWEQLNEVVLVGHSYGGFIVGAVADRIPGRIAALVYLDAIIPVNNMAMLDTVEPSDIPAIVRSTGEHGGYLVPSFPAAAFGVNEADVALVNSLVTPQPFGTLTERITLSGAYMGIRKKVYVHAARHPRMRLYYDRVKDDPTWVSFLLECGHDVMLDAPDVLAKILIEAV